MKKIIFVLLLVVYLTVPKSFARCGFVKDEPKNEFTIHCRNCAIHVLSTSVQITGKRYVTGSSEVYCVGTDKICYILYFGTNKKYLENEEEMFEIGKLTILNDKGEILYNY